MDTGPLEVKTAVTHRGHKGVLAFALTVSFLENYHKEVNQQA